MTRTLSAALFALAALAWAAAARAQDAVELKTNDGVGTPTVRLSATAGAAVGAVNVKNARLQLDAANGYLNVTSSAAAAPSAGDFRYNAGNLLYYNGSAWQTLTTNGSSGSGYVLLAPAAAQADASANPSIFVNDTGGGNLLQLQSGATDRFVVGNTGTVTAATWNGTTVGVGYGGTGTSTAFTTGSVVFAGGSGVYTQDNASFFWDDGNDRLGVGTAVPGQKLEVVGNVYANAGQFLVGTTANNVKRGTTGSFGQAQFWQPNPAGAVNGLYLEHGDSESGGFYADGDVAAIWSPGDGGYILKIYDEDGLPGAGPPVVVTPLLGVDGSGNFKPGTDNQLSIGTSANRWNNGYFANLTLGGVTISSWPSGGVGGSGTANYIPLWTAGTTLGDSRFFQPNANTVSLSATASQTPALSVYCPTASDLFAMVASSWGGSVGNGSGWSYSLSGGGGAMGIMETSGSYKAGLWGLVWTVGSSPVAGVIGTNEANSTWGALSYYDGSWYAGYFNGNVRVTGTAELGYGIQRGGPTGLAGDLGLYSDGAGNWVRYVTNAAPHKWFTDGDYGTTPSMELTSAGALLVGNPSVLQDAPFVQEDFSAGTGAWSVFNNCGTFPTWTNVGGYVRASDPNSTGNSRLDSPAYAVPAGYSNIRLRLRHLLSTENSYDGGFVFVRINGGAWQAVTSVMWSTGTYANNQSNDGT